MPTYDSFCRAPLVDPAYAVLPDGAVHLEGALQRLMDRALETVDLVNLSPLDAVLATKLGGYSELPPMPNLTATVDYLPENPRAFMDAMCAATMIAVAKRSKDAMVEVLGAMQAFTEVLPAINEGKLMPVGADAIRVAEELYRRTGQRFLLALLERLRAQLPDVSGMFHSFPFLKPFTPEPVDEAATDEASQYFRRMRMLGTGALTADALAITAGLALFSGSARDASASKAGVAALKRYHGMPHGAFSADPYLAGRDPSRSAQLEAVCAQMEALHDLLAASGEAAYAEMMERIAENALAGLFQEGGMCDAQAVNRFPTDETCKAAPATPAQSTALLRGLYAVRRSVWMAKSESELALLLPYEGCCLARMDGVPVRASVKASEPTTFTVSLETKQPVEFALSIRVPGYAQSAAVSVNGGKPQAVECGKIYTVRQTFRTGDSIALALECRPFLETGYRGSSSVYCGPLLMALPLPDQQAAWQYALSEDGEPALSWENGRPRAHVDACLAEGWHVKGGKIQPPPQGCGMGEAYELTLLPYADTLGRIAAFPMAARRA